jgi:MSHA biogenesis protein MshJ
MKRLQAHFQRHARRIDTLSLRERAILFVSIAVALVAAFDQLVLSPRMAEQKALAGQIRQGAREVDGLRAQLAPGRIDSPGAKLARELSDLRAQQQQLDQALQQLQGGAAGGTQLPDLLERVLRRHERLTLVRLATVKAANGTSPEAQAQAQTQAQTQPQTQAVQIAMRGSYPDLTQYLADTEAALPGLRWGDVAIARQSGSAELSATVLLNKGPP